MTSNPSIFEKAITGSTDYDEQLAAAARARADARAASALRAARDRATSRARPTPSGRSTTRPAARDGFVVDRGLADPRARHRGHDRGGASVSGRRSTAPNVMVKVPATPEGLPAIRALTARGVNVNITLLFGIPVYEQVIEAYLSGLEALVAAGGDLSRDRLGRELLREPDRHGGRRAARRSHGEDGARARRATSRSPTRSSPTSATRRASRASAGSGWRRRARTPQRLLWASTSTKNPALPDVLLRRGADRPGHGRHRAAGDLRRLPRPRSRAPTLEEDVDEARAMLDRARALGISLDEVTDRVLADGVRLFDEAYAKLLAAVAERDRLARRPADAVAAGRAARRRRGDARRLGGGGQVPAPVAARQLPVDRRRRVAVARLAGRRGRAARAPRAARADRAGSRARRVFTDARAARDGRLEPRARGAGVHLRPRAGQPGAARARLDRPGAGEGARGRASTSRRTLFIVSSKSGTTLEPNIFEDYFFERVSGAVGGRAAPASRFIAITDPGSQLEEVARRDGFRRIAHGVKSIGGRYSALSNFGMVPGAVAGIDVQTLLERAQRDGARVRRVRAGPRQPGAGARRGRSARRTTPGATSSRSSRRPPIGDFGAWLEQLLAESTGKQGRGVIPVDREPLGAPDVYGDDRLFAYLRLEAEPDAEQDRAVDALEARRPAGRADRAAPSARTSAASSSSGSSRPRWPAP